jgi:hypothetical protein
VTGVLDQVQTSSYNGVWKIWKWGSLGLFAIFVGTFLDVARTLRRIETKL